MEGITFGFPLEILLFVLAFLVYWVNAFFIIYHLTRFGIGSQPKIMALIFFLGSAVLFTAVLVAYTQIDLSASITDFYRQLLKPLTFPELPSL